jgi:hypothetical protein
MVRFQAKEDGVMKGLEDLFAKAFDEEAQKRGFVVLDKRPTFGANALYRANALYKTDDWLIGSIMQTMFPETTVTITLTPQNPPPETNKQHLLKCVATWVPDRQKWTMTGREYATSELIVHAFDQMESPKTSAE